MIIDSYDIRPKSCLTQIIILISSGLHCKSQKDCERNALAHLKTRRGMCFCKYEKYAINHFA